jgi:hypothetical protein
VGIGYASSITAAVDMMKAANVPFAVAGPTAEPPTPAAAGSEPSGAGTPAATAPGEATAVAPPPVATGEKVAAVFSQYKWLLLGFGLVLAALLAFLILSLTKKKARPASGAQPQQAASPAASPAPAPSPSPAPAAPSAKSTTYSFGAIKCTAGELSGRTFNLSDKGLNVGRGGGSDISLSSETVSRKHAWIGPVAGEITIKDLGSTNGTFVNGKQIQGAEKLNIGDTINFAKSGQDVFTYTG